MIRTKKLYFTKGNVMAHENDGHRARLRQRMMKEGASGFQDHEVLEMLLFGPIPRKDTNKLAHNLISQFGGFSGVFNASAEQLKLVKGVSDVTACHLAIIKEAFYRYRVDEHKKVQISGLSSIIQYVFATISESVYERLVVVYVDGATNYIMQEEFTSDSTHHVSVNTKSIVTTAMRLNAHGVVLFHCHSSAPCEPSNEDVNFTETLFFALAALDIAVLDHLIFNRQGNYYSFHSHGIMDKMTEKYNKTLKQ